MLEKSEIEEGRRGGPSVVFAPFGAVEAIVSRSHLTLISVLVVL